MITTFRLLNLFNTGTIVGCALFVLVNITKYDTLWNQLKSPVNAGILLFTVLFVFIIVDLFRRDSSIIFSIEDVFLTFLLLYAAIYVFVNFPSDYAWYNVRWLLLYSTSYLIGKRLQSPIEQRTFLIFIYLTAIYQACLTIPQMNLSQLFAGDLTAFAPHEIKGSFSNSSMLACLLSMGIIVGFIMSKKNMCFQNKVILRLGLFFLFIVLLTTTSRAAFLMLLIGVAVASKIKWKYILIGGLLVLGLFFTFKRDSINGRFLIWKVSMQIAKENPFYGVGANRFGAVYNNYQGSYFQKKKISGTESIVARNNFYAFNLPIKILIEYGLIGLILFMVALMYIWIKIRHILILHSLFISFLVFSLFSYPLSQVEIAYLFFSCLGMASTSAKVNSFSFVVKKSFVLNILLGASVLYSSKIELDKRRALNDWEKLNSLMLSPNIDVIQSMKNLKKDLNGFPEFLFHYAVILIQNGKTKDATESFHLCEKRIPSSDLYVYLGICYEEQGDINRAVYAYKFASTIGPNLFVPKYYLFLFYKHSEEFTLAYEKAKEIMKLPKTFNNRKVHEIKEEVALFIKDFDELGNSRR